MIDNFKPKALIERKRLQYLVTSKEARKTSTQGCEVSQHQQ